MLELSGERDGTALTENLRSYQKLPQAVTAALALEEKAPLRGQNIADDDGMNWASDPDDHTD